VKLFSTNNKYYLSASEKVKRYPTFSLQQSADKKQFHKTVFIGA